MRDGLGMDKIMGFSIFPHLMFSITFVSVMHFHNYLCISISPKVLKEIFAEYFSIKGVNLNRNSSRQQCIFFWNKTKYHLYVVSYVKKNF